MEIEPTFKGYVEDEDDALLLLQATVEGKLRHIPRRPYEIERRYLIVSGSVFVFVEEISGIKRWTDGVSWSPSRIAGRFLIYKELDKSQAPAVSKSSSGVKLPPLVSQSSGSSSGSVSPLARSDRAKRYTGFTKKTMSLKFRDARKNTVETLHLVSYYNVEDVEKQRLTRPKDSAWLQGIKPCSDLLSAMENTTLGNSNRTTFYSSTPSSCSSSTSSSPSLSKVTAGSNYVPFVKKATADASLVPPQIVPSTNNFGSQQLYVPFVPVHSNYTSQPVSLPHLNPQPPYLMANSLHHLQPMGQPHVNYKPSLPSLVWSSQPQAPYSPDVHRTQHNSTRNNAPLGYTSHSGTAHDRRNFFTSPLNPPNLR